MFLLLITVLVCLPGFSQKKDFTYKFYGFVRNELYSNTRASMSSFEGVYYLFPLDIKNDAEGNDLNAIPSTYFTAIVSRVGVQMTGPSILKAKTAACIEADFSGIGSTQALLRIRQAYFSLDWDTHHLTVGQTWHPLFGTTMPEMLNLSTGAPFQPFNRSPQIRYQYKTKQGIKLTVAALWQFQYKSNGPEGKSTKYIQQSNIPELYAGIDYQASSGWSAGVGAHMISLKPRTASIVGDKTYKVNERMTATSFVAHTNYKKGKVNFAAKTTLASALDFSAVLVGYGISAIDTRTGEQEYTPFRHSASWVSFSYGTKWKPNLFIGYAKNLGTGKSLVENAPKYGLGLDIDQLFTVNVGLSYLFLNHWKIGVEYSPSTAWYGSADEKGRIDATHSVTNHRTYLLTAFYF